MLAGVVLVVVVVVVVVVTTGLVYVILPVATLGALYDAAVVVSSDEDDDVDVRTRGLLIHGVWAELICRSLNMKEGVERNNLVPHSLASAQIDENYLRSEILNIVDEKAPWLRRSDAIATVRRLDLVGLDLNSYEEALEGKCELTTSGRFGRLLDTELSICLLYTSPRPRDS